MERQKSKRNNHAIKQKRAGFRKAKRRLALGVSKPSDVTTLARLAKELKYV